MTVYELPPNFNQLPDPYLHLSELREAAPAVRVRAAAGMDAWLVTRYNDVRAGLADARFSSDPARASERTRAAMSTTMSRTVAMFSGTMVTTDPPEHTRLRRVASRGFTAEASGAMRPHLESVASRSMDAVTQSGGGDLGGALVDSLVAAVAGEILGVPRSEQDTVLEAMDAMVEMPIDEEAQRRADEAAATLQRRFSDLLDLKAAEPAADVLSVLAAARREGRLSHMETLTTALLLLGSSLINPRGALGCALLTLLAHPQALSELADDPALLPGAADELLRYDGPLALGMVRYAATDVEVAGTVIPRGAQVYMGIGSANRDQRRFADPDRLDLRRTDNAHLAFGNGVHRCLGVAATRLLLQVALEALLRRAPDAMLAVPPEEVRWQPSVVRSPAEIPVALSREGAGSR